MIRSCLCHISKSQTIQKIKFNRLEICHKRLLSNDNGDRSQGDGPSSLPEELDGRYVPRRIRKRLKEKGLSIDDLEYKAGGMDLESSSNEVVQALKSSVIDKNFPAEFPSDFERRKEARRQEKHAYRPTDVETNETSIVFFPGQGSQFVGMGKKLLPYPGVEELYRKASEILGYDLLEMCLGGPSDMLNKTIHCQPAVVVTSLAALERLKEEYPQALEKCVAMAGFSVGEITALIASEMISFEDGIHLINLRANAMQKSSEAVASGMLTVKCDHNTKLLSAMVAAREYCSQKLGIEEPICKVANYLCTNVKVVAGHEEALVFLQQYGKEWGVVNTKRLPVSGAFHTRLMFTSKEYWKYWNAWDDIKLQKPKYKVHANLDGKQYKYNEENLEPIKFIFKKQPLRPVVWEQLMHILYTRPKETPQPNTFEVGPGRQLGYLLRSTNMRAFEKYKNIEC